MFSPGVGYRRIPPLMMLFPLSEFLRLVLEAVLENIFLDFLKFIFFGFLILVPFFVVSFRVIQRCWCHSVGLYRVQSY